MLNFALGFIAANVVWLFAGWIKLLMLKREHEHRHFGENRKQQVGEQIITITSRE